MRGKADQTKRLGQDGLCIQVLFLGWVDHHPKIHLPTAHAEQHIALNTIEQLDIDAR
ncbi:hypothetical protein SDC9_205955 [bioreactor metagenome]|uniref:Uncharacterized protein n=1 Tax=bioreactor metagenome TaxID=1076179 RepID=A0A645J536_9ZZZZ